MTNTRSQQFTFARKRLQAGLAEQKNCSQEFTNQVLDRFDRWGDDLLDGLAGVYHLERILDPLIDIMVSTIAARPADLRARDHQRVLRPDWFQDSQQLGYVAYADLFAEDLAGVGTHIDYLTDLGVTYLHLMPLLTPRPDPNDGGYAVADYRTVRADLGTMDDLSKLATQLHAAGISLTLDLVLNHVAEEHEWAQRAKAGEEKYRDYFYIYPDHTVPDRFEKTLPEVFPAFAPGNFTWSNELNGWVWTTFNSWQWDVRWINPEVFCEYADIIGFLANQGVDCLRLDAIAFIFKREGTNCQNQPEVHSITQALRAFSHIVAPALIFKAEAIVGPQDVQAYLGSGEHAGKVSDLAYHNSLMVQIWSALAAQDSRLLVTALERFAPTPSTTAWATYLRCHDDIGWAIDDFDASQAGADGYLHRAFLADFYAGDFPGSYARGAHFQSNPVTGDRRTSGSAASLAGIETALESKSAEALTAAINRMLCAYAIVFGFGGLPLLYMGDELGLLNTDEYLMDPAKASDNRWMHRPSMPWKSEPHAAAKRINAGIRNLIRARKALPGLHATTSSRVAPASDPAVLFVNRTHPAGSIVEVYNLSDQVRTVDTWPISSVLGSELYENIAGRDVDLTGVNTQSITVPPYAYWWFTHRT